MTDRLYYTDPKLLEFDAQIVEFTPDGDRIRMVLDRSAFYPTSGGQLHDTGWLGSATDEVRLQVVEVSEADNGTVIHFLDPAGLQVVEVSEADNGTVIHF